MISRRTVLALAAAAAVAPNVALAQTTPAASGLRAGTQPAEFSANLFCGIDEGIFARHGLRIDLQMLPNGAATAAALSGGALDVGLADPLTVAEGFLRGIDLVFVAPGAEFAPPWPLAWVTRPDAGITAAKDFNGKTIGINGLKNAPAVMSYYWLDHNGADSRSVKWVEIPFPSAIGAIVQKRIDGELMPEPFLTAARDAGLHVTLMEHNTSAAHWMVNGWITTREWARKNPAVLSAFVAAMHEANHWANTHVAGMVPIVAKYTKISEPVVARMMQHPWAETLRAELVAPVLDTCVSYGVLEKKVAASSLFYTDR